MQKGCSVRLFRRTGKNSFSVQLSPSSGVVEVHCTEVDVLPNTFAAREELEENLILLSQKHRQKTSKIVVVPHCLNEGGRWEVQICRLGSFSMESHGFVQCHILFQRMEGNSCEKKEEEEKVLPSPLEQKSKKKSLKWVQLKL
jgi:hypothetical protein